MALRSERQFTVTHFKPIGIGLEWTPVLPLRPVTFAPPLLLRRAL
jgi:hypothetical protein